MKVCANETCENIFTPNKHNQIYCCSECCKIATNRKVMAKYYERKARLNGAERVCACGAKLSRYNDSKVCVSCSQQHQREEREKLMRIIEG